MPLPKSPAAASRCSGLAGSPATHRHGGGETRRWPGRAGEARHRRSGSRPRRGRTSRPRSGARSVVDPPRRVRAAAVAPAVGGAPVGADDLQRPGPHQLDALRSRRSPPPAAAPAGPDGRPWPRGPLARAVPGAAARGHPGQLQPLGRRAAARARRRAAPPGRRRAGRRDPTGRGPARWPRTSRSSPGTKTASAIGRHTYPRGTLDPHERTERHDRATRPLSPSRPAWPRCSRAA